MQLECQDIPGGRMIRVADARIDAASAIMFKDRLRTAAGDGPGPVVLDLAAVDFLDSSGLGAVVASMKLLGAERPLQLAGLTPAVEKVFRLTRMDSVFVIHADAVTARDALRNAR
jgi:anti-sigma B factor antagonist